MNSTEITNLEQQIHELTQKLNELRKVNREGKVRNYKFTTLEGDTTLLDLFGERKGCW